MGKTLTKNNTFKTLQNRLLKIMKDGVQLCPSEKRGMCDAKLSYIYLNTAAAGEEV